MFDIFYTGKKPELPYRLTPATDLADAANKSTTRHFWLIDGKNDYSNFDFYFKPNAWQANQTHAFPGLYNQDSGTYYAAKAIAETAVVNYTHLEQVHEIGQIVPKIKKHKVSYFYVDHLNERPETIESQIDKPYTKMRYVTDYKSVFKRIQNVAKTEYVMILSSLCDYSNFDLDWLPLFCQDKMLHVFPSNDQVYGDTFFVHVPSIDKHLRTLAHTEYAGIAALTTHRSVTRYPMDQVVYDTDDLTSVIKAHDFKMPYAYFTPWDQYPRPPFTPSMWRAEDRAIHVFTGAGSVVAAPKIAKASLDTQCYDYELIKRHYRPDLMEKPLDIVYISNDEPDAERWYNHLCDVAPSRKIHRVKNIDGRALAYKLAAVKSTTQWFFAVFAKLEVNPEFDWDWQPDRLQEPKHYIFNATNPVNGLEYGHMAMIAYNKKLILDTEFGGLDFTLSKAHEVIDMNSGIAHYNVSPIVTWRTAFREVIKLLNDIEQHDSADSKKRLAAWLTSSDAKNSEWSVNGAIDAKEYYKCVNGNYDKLLSTFDWEWLNFYFVSKYPTTNID